MSGGKGGSESTSQQTSRSRSDSSSSTFIDPAQRQYLDFLRSQAQGLAAAQMDTIGSAAGGLSAELGGIGRDAVGALTSGMGGAFGAARDAFGAFSPNVPMIAAPGAAPQANAQSISGDFIAPTIEALGADINRQLARGIGGAGGIDTGFAGTGTLGGGRNQIARGLAAEESLRTFGREAAGIRLADAQQRQQLEARQAIENARFAAQNQALSVGAQQANQNAALSGSGQELQALIASAGTLAPEFAGNEAALAALPQLNALGLSPFAAQFAPLASFGSILGGPTVLSEGQSSSFSTGQATSRESSSPGLGGLLRGFGGFMGGAGALLGALG